MKTKSKFDPNSIHLSLFAIIRIAIGWHFMYEGVTKILSGNLS